jgi:transcriptional regulator with XRE-family HTH domain
MERDEAKARGAALRAFLQSRLPVTGAGSVTALARKAGIRPTTATSWWTKGKVPDNASLRLLADALSVELSDLVSAYDGSGGHSWVFTDSELEALLERTVETTVRRVLAGDDVARGIADRVDSTGTLRSAPTPSKGDPPGPPTRGPGQVGGS